MDGFDAARGGGGEGCCETGCGCGACDSCAAWREHYYWNHMSDDKKQFLLIAASEDFRHSMRIPPEVGSHLRNLISESQVKLEVPNGREYLVEVRKEFGDVVLRSGWNEFVNAHHIEENDSILFMYRGNSSFKVHLFNSAGHEKSLSCPQPPYGISGAVPPFSPCDHHVLNEQVVPNPRHVTSVEFDYTMLSGCHLTKAQDKEVLNVACAMRSKSPLYVAVMSNRNVSLKNCYVYIPSRLLDNFKEEMTKASVQLEAPDNKTYSVEARKHSDDQIIIESGWNAFVASLRVQENDLLIFSSRGKTRLEVLILDPSGREKTSSSFAMGNLSSSAQEVCDDSVQIVDPPPHQVIDLISLDDDDIMREGRRESYRAQKRVTRSCAKTQKMASTSSPCTKSVIESSSSDDDNMVRGGTRESCMAQMRVTRSTAKILKMTSTSSPCTRSGYGPRKPHDRAPVKLRVRPEPVSSNLGGSYILQRWGTLPLQVKKKVEEKVQTIRSKLPIFVKVMTRSSVDGTGCKTCEMVFCSEYGECLPKQSQQLVLQLEGKERQWQATLDIRSDICYLQRKISKGWKEFSRQNELEVGDICLFKLEDTNTSNLRMTVYLIRKSQIQL